MGTGGLIGTIFVVLCVVIGVVEWVRRDIKPRMQVQQPRRAPEGPRAAR